MAKPKKVAGGAGSIGLNRRFKVKARHPGRHSKPRGMKSGAFGRHHR